MSIPGRVSSLAYLLTLHPRAQHRRDRYPTRSCSGSQQGPQPASASWSYPRPPCAFSGKPSEKGELPEPGCGALAPGDFAHSCVLWSGPENTTMLRPSLRLRLREARNFSCDPSRPGGILGTKLELGRAGTLAAAGPCTPEMKVREGPSFCALADMWSVQPHGRCTVHTDDLPQECGLNTARAILWGGAPRAPDAVLHPHLPCEPRCVRGYFEFECGLRAGWTPVS